MNREIPGFYYDSAKRKYFRIEESRTAPADAAWSAQNVKRRAAEEQDAERRRERLRREARRVRRWAAADDPLTGGLLAREVGDAGRDETVVRAWAGGLRDKGSVTLTEGGRGRVWDFWVGGDDERSGLGVVYALFEGGHLAASYIPRDEDDRINFSFAAERYPAVRMRPALYPHPLRGCAAVRFHEPSSRMLLACQDHRGDVAIKHFRACSENASDAGPTWVLPGDDGIPRVHESRITGGRFAHTIHTLQPAPPSSPLVCVAGTERGIIQLRPDDTLTWLTPPSPPPPPPPAPQQRGPRGKKRPGIRHHSHRTEPKTAPWQGSVLSLDFSPQNPAALLLAGTRSSHISLLDLRVPPQQWWDPAGAGAQNSSSSSNSSSSGGGGSGTITITHTSSAAHVRCVGPYGVLAAGPRSAMALYDVRFLQRRRTQDPSRDQDQTRQPGTMHHGAGGTHRVHSTNATRPVLTFPHYQNEAHIQIGLDVLADPAYGASLGASSPATGGVGGSSGGIVSNRSSSSGGGSAGAIVAAAHDDGTVGLYSLGDGRRLATGAVDGVMRAGGPVARRVMWRALPGDRHPSLFVGDGAEVRKFSFWA